NPEAMALNLVFGTGPGSLEERAVYTNEIRDELEAGETAGGVVIPEGVRATPSGLAVVGVGLLENIRANRILLTYLAIAFVFAFLTIRLRSVVRALLSMVPVLIATGAASLAAWILGLELSPMTAVGGPLVVALCTGFTSLIPPRRVEPLLGAPPRRPPGRPRRGRGPRPGAGPARPLAAHAEAPGAGGGRRPRRRLAGAAAPRARGAPIPWVRERADGGDLLQG